jgi:hypothetical protein
MLTKKEEKMKKTFSVLLTLAVAVSLLVVPAVVSASSTTLIASGIPGTEARITVPVPAGTTLGDISSISWEEYLVEGYPPHVDIIVDLGGGSTDALVFEYAYNDMGHYAEGQPTYGAVTGAWFDTFNDDGGGPSAVTNTSYGWLSSGASGSPGDAGHYAGTLAEWKAGGITGGLGINNDTLVLRLEIEVDNWLVDTEALVRNIQVNGSPAGNTVVGLIVDVPDIVAISVNPTVIDFGTLLPGQTSAVFDITVANIGTHKVDVDASASGSALFCDNLMLKNEPKAWTDWSVGTPWSIIVDDLAMDASDVVKTKLTVPLDYTPLDTETGTLIFEATPV